MTRSQRISDIWDETFRNVKKGRGQKKNRRNKEGRERHRGTIILTKFFRRYEGLPVEEVRAMITFE